MINLELNGTLLNEFVLLLLLVLANTLYEDMVVVSKSTNIIEMVNCTAALCLILKPQFLTKDRALLVSLDKSFDLLLPLAKIHELNPMKSWVNHKNISILNAIYVVAILSMLSKSL